MAQRKQRSATTREKISISQSVASEARGKDIAAVARKNLLISPTESWRDLTMEDKEIVVSRLYGGESVSMICKDLGINPGHIYRACYLDDEYAQRVATARTIGQHALVDQLWEIPFREDMSSADKHLLSDNIKWAAARIAKASTSPLGNYNERTEVHERTETVQIVLPSQFDGIEADFAVVPKPDQPEISKGPCGIADGEKR